MELRLRPIQSDPAGCPNCRSNAFLLFLGADKGHVVTVECVNCAHTFTLEAAQPQLRIQPVIEVTVDPKVDTESLRRIIGENRSPLREGRIAFLNGKALADNPHPKMDRAHQIWAEGFMGMEAAVANFPKGTMCHGASDGECNWAECPQLRDGEPALSGRHCPLDLHEHHEER